MYSPHDPLLSLDEAGELLGTGPGFPGRLIADGHLDHVQDGGTVRVAQSALIAYVTATERQQPDARVRPIRDAAGHVDSSAADDAAPAA